jgi:hypothetical protein
MIKKQDTFWSPLEIELLLKAYYYEIEPKDIITRAHSCGVEQLLRSELIDLDVIKIKGSYTITEKGKAFIEMLLNTPLPTLKWIDPRTL